MAAPTTSFAHAGGVHIFVAFDWGNEMLLAAPAPLSYLQSR
jgi:hypothetical protein